MLVVALGSLLGHSSLLNAQSRQFDLNTWVPPSPESMPEHTDAPSANDVWYGVKTGLPNSDLYVKVPDTYPWYVPASCTQQGTQAPGPVMPSYELSSTAGYHNATVYRRASFVANAVRRMNLNQAEAKNQKEVGDSLVGKSPASLSFWQWVKLGEMALKTYGKIASIVRALNAGDVNIDVWKLVPKIGVLSEDDPNAPAIIMGLVPGSDNSIRLAREVVNFDDPRYYLGNLVRFDDLDRLVPSLSVKPSLYGAYAHMATSDETLRNQAMYAKVMQNFHELRTGMSMLNRYMMGKSRSEQGIKRNRFSTAWADQVGKTLETQANTLDDLYAASRAGARFFGEGYSEGVRSLQTSVMQTKSLEIRRIQDAVEMKAADTWKAKRIGGALANLSIPLETNEYAEGIEKVQALVQEYATTEGNHGQYGDKKILIGLAVADAWTNKLIHDELRALRQIYAMQIQRESLERLAPYVAQSMEEIQGASKRLQRLQTLLGEMQVSQQAAGAFFNAKDIARIAERLDVK